MASREDMLRELGLAPSWRLRASFRAAIAREGREQTPANIVEAHDETPTDIAEAPVDIAVEDRLSRIARLEWSSFSPDVAACTACGLCRTRNKTVPGVGDVKADWMFVGEAPGAEEDARGEPFVGQAGRLLDSMLAALGINRSKRVYIANVLKCRPPDNRTPEPAEVAACRPYLDRQIAMINPRIIVALGKSAAISLLNVEASVASLRNRVHRYRDVPLVVTYHPAYLLRTLPDKAKAWEDLCLARATLQKQSSTERA